ncbi:MAG: lipid-A-disaccharide synthase [Devosia sp.]
MPEPLSLFILAGEPSGDRIAGHLVQKLALRRALTLTGVGGEALVAQGLKSLFPMSDLSVMGWSDVLPRLPLLLWRVRQVARAILDSRPDIVVLVDSQVFSKLVARQVRAGGGRMPILLYVAPAVWAWKPERALALPALFDEILSVLPFEPAAMRDLGGPETHYVGHPALEKIAFQARLGPTGPILLLPGSRVGQMRRHLPLMRAAAESLAQSGAEAFSILAPAALRPAIAAAVADWPLVPEVVSGEVARDRLFAEASLAVAISGTITLELALAGVPMVTTYLGDRGQAKRFRQYGVRFAALPNILAQGPVVPEILMEAPEPGRLAAAAVQLYRDPQAQAEQRSAFAALRRTMETGTADDPREDPADRVLARLA